MTNRIGIVVSRFNAEITERLLGSCLAALRRGGLGAARVRVVRVPGGFEIPWAVYELARSRRYGAVIALGCVLKGSTRQNEYIAQSLTRQLHEISVRTRVPVLFGVITPNTWTQALARTKGSLNRGREAAEAALEMLAVRRGLRGTR